MNIEHQGKKYRPFKNAEEFNQHREKWVCNLTPDDTLFRVGSMSNIGVTIKGVPFSWDDLLKKARFEDGSPCGVLDEPKWRPATQADVTVPPKTCRVRQADNDQWKPYRRLVYIYNTDSENKYLTINPNDNAQANWKYCEVME